MSYSLTSFPEPEPRLTASPNTSALPSTSTLASTSQNVAMTDSVVQEAAVPASHQLANEASKIEDESSWGWADRAQIC